MASGHLHLKVHRYTSGTLCVCVCARRWGATSTSESALVRERDIACVVVGGGGDYIPELSKRKRPGLCVCDGGGMNETVAELGEREASALNVDGAIRLSPWSPTENEIEDERERERKKKRETLPPGFRHGSRSGVS